MSITYLNYNAAGTDIVDEPLVVNTATDQRLVHDNIMSIEVWTGQGKSGDQLEAGTDYELKAYDSFYKTYNAIRFTTHNTATVYCTYLTLGDTNDADDVNSKLDKHTAANSLLGNNTASAGNASAIALGANQFLARGSTGNIAAKSISDFGLSVVAADGYLELETLATTPVVSAAGTLKLFAINDSGAMKVAYQHAGGTVILGEGGGAVDYEESDFGNL